MYMNHKKTTLKTCFLHKKAKYHISIDLAKQKCHSHHDIRYINPDAFKTNGEPTKLFTWKITQS